MFTEKELKCLNNLLLTEITETEVLIEDDETQDKEELISYKNLLISIKNKIFKKH